MARVDDGEVFLEIENAREDDVRRGLVAARRVIDKAGVEAAAVFAAQVRVDAAGLTELEWEQGLIDKPEEASDADEELSNVADDAWQAAVVAAGYNPAEAMVIGQLGLVGSA